MNSDFLFNLMSSTERVLAMLEYCSNTPFLMLYGLGKAKSSGMFAEGDSSLAGIEIKLNALKTYYSRWSNDWFEPVRAVSRGKWLC